MNTEQNEIILDVLKGLHSCFVKRGFDPETLGVLEKGIDRLNNLAVKTVIFNPADFKYMRGKLGLSLREVEAVTGLSNAYLSLLENGKIKKPSFEAINTLLKLYKA